MHRLFYIQTTTVGFTPTLNLNGHDAGFSPSFSHPKFSGFQAAPRQVIYLWDR